MVKIIFLNQNLPCFIEYFRTNLTSRSVHFVVQVTLKSFVTRKLFIVSNLRLLSWLYSCKFSENVQILIFNL